MAKILTRNQFKQTRPNGKYANYLSFVAKRRGISVDTLKSEAPRYTPAEFKQLQQRQALTGNTTGNMTSPGVPTAGGGRASQSAQQVRKRGYMKWYGEKYRKGDAWKLAADMKTRGQSYDTWAKRHPKLAAFLGPIEAAAGGAVNPYIAALIQASRQYGIRDPAVLLAVAYEEAARDRVLRDPSYYLANPGDHGTSFGPWQIHQAGGLGTGISAQQLVDPTFSANLIARTWADYGGRNTTGLGGLIDYYVRVGRGSGDMRALAQWTHSTYYDYARKQLAGLL